MSYARTIGLASLVVGLLGAGTIAPLPVVAQTIAPTVEQKKVEADRFLQQGIQQYQVSQFEAAFQSWQKALKLYRELKDRQGEGNALGNLGITYSALGNYLKAIEFQEQSLAIARELKDRQGEGNALGNLGNAYRALGNYPKAIEYQEQLLAIAREIKDRRGEGAALGNLGITYRALGNYPKAIEFQEQRLVIAHEIKDRQGEGNALGNLGIAYYSLGNYPKAIEFQEQSLVIAREIKDRQGEGNALGNLGIAYRSLGNYPKAIEFQEQRLVIAREIKDRQGEGAALGNLGVTYYSLGNYPKAIEYQEQRLVIAREIKDRQSEGAALGNLGNAYRSLGNYPKAIKSQEQSLAITREIKDRFGEGAALGNLGIAYYSLGNYPKAIESQEQRLAIVREIKDRLGEGQSLGNLGIAYYSLGNYPKAIEYYEQYLVIAREIKDRAGERSVLNNLGEVLTKKEPELAIVFYKQSVQVAESIRADNRKLSRDLQNSYTETVVGTYRRLADLLLSQGRVLEAQQVLELLKIQELRDFTKNTRYSETNSNSDLQNPLERPISKTHADKIKLGNQLTDCEAKKCAEYSQLVAQVTTANTEYRDLIKRLKDALKKNEVQDPAQLQNPEFTRNAQNIILANPNRKTLLLYPLVLDDKLWLVWGSQAGKTGVVFDSKEIVVSRKELSAKAEQLRRLLGDRTSDPSEIKQVSQQIYKWLIEPIRPQLEANKIDNIVFSLDRATRYIPMAALHDGKQYLVENFNLSTILTAQTDTTDKLTLDVKNNPVLGLGVTDSIAGFNPLPYVQTELDRITTIYPGLKLFNKDFTETSLRENIPNHRILHIATHGSFVTNDPDNSFILLGDGKQLKIPTIETLTNLAGTHLVVLSACETGKGGMNQEGMEVAGMGHYFLRSGAKSVMASLWLVNDPATALMMEQFYKQLAAGKSKPEAMRQVQQDFINGKLKPGNTIGNRWTFELPSPAQNQTKQPQFDDFTHPYYWAPFILIGNAQ